MLSWWLLFIDFIYNFFNYMYFCFEFCANNLLVYMHVQYMNLYNVQYVYNVCIEYGILYCNIVIIIVASANELLLFCSSIHIYK